MGQGLAVSIVCMYAHHNLECNYKIARVSSSIIELTIKPDSVFSMPVVY